MKKLPQPRQPQTAAYSPYPRSENINFRNRSQSFENRDRRSGIRSNNRRPQDYRNFSRERQYNRNDCRARYSESNSLRQDYKGSNSSNQNSRDNSRDRISNRVQFRENKVNGFFVDNQQDEINLNQTSLRTKIKRLTFLLSCTFTPSETVKNIFLCFESQFLVDTGATCFLTNFDFLQELIADRC